MSSFSLDLKAFEAKTNAKGNAIVRQIVFGVDESLVLKSPVGNPDLWAEQSLPPPKGYVGGRFRSNWQYAESEAPEGELYEPNNGTGYPDASDTIASVVAQVAPDAGGKLHFLVNNLPYARRLEDGWSTQAPSGMVALTVIEFQNIVLSAFLKMKTGYGGLEGGFEI